MEQQHLGHAGEDAGIGDEIARRRDKKDFRPLLVDGQIHSDPSGLFNIVDHKLERIHHTMRRDGKVVSQPEAVGYRLDDPVHIEPQQPEQFAGHHGHFGGVDSVRTEDGTAPAFGTLEEVVEPLFDDVDGEFAGTDQLGGLAECAAELVHEAFTIRLIGLRRFLGFAGLFGLSVASHVGDCGEDLAKGGEVLAVDGSQQFGTQDRHVLGIAAADEEVALVRTGSASDANIHEELEGPVLAQPVGHSFQDGLLPTVRQFPVVVGDGPVPGIGQVEDLQVLGLARINERATPDIDGRICPFRLGGPVIHLQQVFLLVIIHVIRSWHRYSLSTGTPAAFILSLSSSSYSS